MTWFLNLLISFVRFVEFVVKELLLARLIP